MVATSRAVRSAVVDSEQRPSRARQTASMVWGWIVLAAFAAAAIFLVWIAVTRGLWALGVVPLALIALIVFLVVRAARRR